MRCSVASSRSPSSSVVTSSFGHHRPDRVVIAKIVGGLQRQPGQAFLSGVDSVPDPGGPGRSLRPPSLQRPVRQHDRGIDDGGLLLHPQILHPGVPPWPVPRERPGHD